MSAGPCHWCLKKFPERHEVTAPWDRTKRQFCDACLAWWQRMLKSCWERGRV